MKDGIKVLIGTVIVIIIAILVFVVLIKMDCSSENYKKIKLIDGFTFFNELKMLSLRLKELHNVVDYFIIVESPWTYSGQKKPLYFNENKHLYKDYLNQIIHIIVDDMPIKQYVKDKRTWENENYQRTSIDRGIATLHLKDNDLIIISDVDEIPDTKVLSNLKQKNVKNIIYNLSMDFFYYNFTCIEKNGWAKSKILNYKTYKKNNKDPQVIRSTQGSETISNAGWHLSYFMDAEHIIQKIKNFSHSEYNKPEYLNKDKIQKSIDNCDDLFTKNKKWNKINIKDNNHLPKHYKLMLD